MISVTLAWSLCIFGVTLANIAIVLTEIHRLKSTEGETHLCLFIQQAVGKCLHLRLRH